MMIGRPRPRLVIGMAAVLLVSGCAQPEASTPTPPAATATTGAPAAMELEATGEDLPAGTYTCAGFEPPVTFDLDGSWQAVQLGSGFFDVQQESGTPQVIAVQFARPSGIYGAEGSPQSVSAEEAVTVLGENPRRAIVESSESRMGALVGWQVTVENAGNGHATVMQVPAGALGIDPGRRLWTAFFDTPDGLLAIMVGGPTNGWEEALAAAEPVLESVRIGE